MPRKRPTVLALVAATAVRFATVIAPAPTVRPATVSDAGPIAEVHVSGWRWAYRGQVPDAVLDALSVEQRAQSWGKALANEKSRQRVWVAERDERIVGFAATGPAREPDIEEYVGELRAIYLVEEAASTGVGRALLAWAVEDLRERGFHGAIAWVLATNARARRFYEAAGWKPDGRTRSEPSGGVVLEEVRYRVGL